MKKIDSLIDVANKLREARVLGERCADPALLYFIDMTIAHLCVSLDARFESESAKANRATRIRAAA
jgi:hypothetical protein